MYIYYNLHNVYTWSGNLPHLEETASQGGNSPHPVNTNQQHNFHYCLEIKISRESDLQSAESPIK